MRISGTLTGLLCESSVQSLLGYLQSCESNVQLNEWLCCATLATRVRVELNHWRSKLASGYLRGCGPDHFLVWRASDSIVPCYPRYSSQSGEIVWIIDDPTFDDHRSCETRLYSSMVRATTWSRVSNLLGQDTTAIKCLFGWWSVNKRGSTAAFAEYPAGATAKAN